MSTLGEIVTRVQRQAGDSSGALFTRDDIVSWANEGQLEIVRKTECLTAHRQTNSTGDDNSYELPNDFLFMKRVTLDNMKLQQTSLDDLDNLTNYIDDSTSDLSTYYYLSDNVLFLYPTPSSSVTAGLDIWYVRQPATLIDDNDVPEIPLWMHKEITQYCKAQAKELDDDIQGQQKAQSLFDGNVSEIQYELRSQPVNTYPAIRCLPGDM